MARIERVKRRVLQEAVAENLEVIRGLPPRAVRHRHARLWLRRAPLVLVAFALVISSYRLTSVGAVPVPAALASIVAPSPEAQSAEAGIERVAAAAFPLAVRRVVLDAGHGGSDPGATSEKLTEKAITLDIGKRLRTRLEREGFEVIVTRSDDRTIALKERARLANDSRSDIFVSIHVNTIVQHTASRGVETYYLGPATDPSLTKLAAAENTVSGYSLGDMRKLLDGVYADARRDESLALATSLQKQLHGTLRKHDPGLEDWGVKRAPFLVLVATEMPAVLAEVGCLSNEKEAALLGRPEYRQQIADALFEGIRAYAKKGSSRNG